MREPKTSDAQLRASTKWNQKNKEKMKRVRQKSSCKKYIETANTDELKEVKNWTEERENNLKE